MSYIRKDPLRAVTDEERDTLSKVARASSERADRVRRAKALLAVSDGASYVDAASDARFRSNDSVSMLVTKFNTATWSLTLLQRALRSADDGLPNVSTYTIFQTLKEAGYSWQRTRTWCSTGTVQRKRKGGTVTVTDPEAQEKRDNWAGIYYR